MQILSNKLITEAKPVRNLVVRAKNPGVRILADGTTLPVRPTVLTRRGRARVIPNQYVLTENAEVCLGQDKERIELHKGTGLEICPKSRNIIGVHSSWRFRKQVPTGDIISVNIVKLLKEINQDNKEIQTWSYENSDGDIGQVTTWLGKFWASLLSHDESGEMSIILKQREVFLDGFDMQNVHIMNFKNDHVALEVHGLIRRHGEYIQRRTSFVTIRFDNAGKFLSLEE